MKFVLLSFLLILGGVSGTNQATAQLQMPMYHSVRITFSPAFQLNDAEQFGIELEHALIKKDCWIETVVSDQVLTRLRNRGLDVTIVIENLTQYYQARNSASFRKQVPTLQSTPEHFILGSNGGYYTLQEIYDNFRTMQTFAPATVSSPIEIGRSCEQRPLYAYRFGTGSDDKPQVLFTALHHAREPGSASTLIYFLWKLLEDAAKGDPEAVYLLSSRVLYVVPVVNPDGYLYNETKGFGTLWRKNRRDNKDGSFGVDLNRNYGPQSFWDSPDGGSSEKPYEDTYRGPAAFSEPETQAIRDFVLSHSIKICINYHTFSNVVIYPYGYVNKESPDSAFFRAFSADASKYNKYSAGRDVQTVGYPTRGVSDDWLYALDAGKPTRTYSFTSEVGTRLDGFYAPKERIIPQCEENLYFNYQAVWSADVNLRILDATVEQLSPNQHSPLSVRVQNTGLHTPQQPTSLLLHSLDKRLLLHDTLRTISPLSSAQLITLTFDAEVTRDYPNGETSLVETILLQDGVERRDTLRLQFNQPTVRVLYGSSLTDTNWTLSTWGIMPNPEGGFMLADSPRGNYEDSTSNYLQSSSPIDIISARSASLEFWTRWSIESNFDFGVVQVSENNGRSWENIQTSRMKPSSKVKGSRQAEDSYGFDGNFPTWVRQECSLNNYIGKKILLRFGVLSDARSNFDGMFLRDISLKIFKDSMGGITADPTTPTTLEAFPTPVDRGRMLYAVLSRRQGQLPEKPFHLALYSTLGGICFEQSGTTLSGNEFVLSIPTASLASGAYQLVVEYDGEKYMVNCQVIR